MNLLLARIYLAACCFQIVVPAFVELLPQMQSDFAVGALRSLLAGEYNTTHEEVDDLSKLLVIVKDVRVVVCVEHVAKCPGDEVG